MIARDYSCIAIDECGADCTCCSESNISQYNWFNFEKAVEQMKEGKKVVSDDFNGNECIYIDDGEFWKYSKQPYFPPIIVHYRLTLKEIEGGWRLYNENES